MAAVAAAGLVAATATGVAGATPGSAHRDATGTTLTLITGDRVVLDGTAVVSVEAGPGRGQVGFHAFHRDGRLPVVPRDAFPALANGKLDLRLFDVTGLVEAGYDDARRDTVPLIITGDQPRAGVQVTRALPTVGAVAARTAKSEAAATFQALVDDPGVKKVWLDGIRKPSLDRSVAQIGAPTEVHRLPLSVVRFTPRLDANGGTPAGRVLRIPLTVDQQQGADNGKVRKVEVDVSFDDGKTWSKVPVVGGAALVRNAGEPGFASLRAKGSDSKGNTFEHTVVRAYRVG